MSLWGKIICAVKRKHARGSRIESVLDDNHDPIARIYECPRCGAQWTRKVSKRKQKEAA